MSLSGPIAQVIRFFAKKSAKTLRNVVENDIKIADKANPWTHADKIKELATDSGISKSYIQGLISKSSKPEQLLNIKGYLQDSIKAGNLTNRERYDLFAKIVTKIKKIEDYKAFKDVLDHGKDIIDHL